MSKKLSRRDMLKYSTGILAGTVLASCAPAAAPTTAPVVEPTKAPEAPKPAEPTATTAAAEPEQAQPTAAAAPKAVEGHVVIMHQTNEFSQDQIDVFQKDNPGITVELIDITGQDLTRFYAMYAAGTPPDLVRVQAPSIPQFLARKLLYDLTPYFETSQLLKMDDLMPANDNYKAESPLKTGKGKIYGMVKDFSPDCSVYAYKPAFEAANVPVPDDTKSLSFAEIQDLSNKVTKKEGDRILMFGYGYERAWVDRFWMVALKELGKSLYSEGYDKIILTADEDTKKIAQWYFDMAKSKLTYSAVNPSPAGWNGTDFTAGQLAFMQYGFWFSAMAEGEKTKGQVIMLPSPNWAGKHMDPTVTATGMVMTAASQAPDATWKVFEYYNGGQPALDRAKSGWGVPGLKSMLPLIPQETEFQKQARKVLDGELGLNDGSIQFNPFLGETQVSASYAKFEEQALKGEITFEQMLKNIEDEVNAAIKDGIAAIMG
jgi:multiple sugar transport system substrate-binding protein